MIFDLIKFITFDLFNGCKQLRSLNFNNNKLKKLDEELFIQCKDSLEKINFSYNEIDLLPDDLFKECNQLEYIDFSNNKRPTKNEIKEELKRLMV